MTSCSVVCLISVKKHLTIETFDLVRHIADFCLVTTNAPMALLFGTTFPAWGYGFLSVTIINMCAFGGLLVLPITKTRYYQATLLFMVSLAVGTLCGSSLLILIPEVRHRSTCKRRLFVLFFFFCIIIVLFIMSFSSFTIICHACLEISLLYRSTSGIQANKICLRTVFKKTRCE